MIGVGLQEAAVSGQIASKTPAKEAALLDQELASALSRGEASLPTGTAGLREGVFDSPVFRRSITVCQYQSIVCCFPQALFWLSSHQHSCCWIFPENELVVCLVFQKIKTSAGYFPFPELSAVAPVCPLQP